MFRINNLIIQKSFSMNNKTKHHISLLVSEVSLALIFFGITMPIHAYAEFLEFYTIGKRCNYERIDGHNPDGQHVYICMTVIGDTIVGEYEGRKLQNIQQNPTEDLSRPFITEHIFVVKEKDGCTYSYDDELDYWIPQCDFTLTVGDTIKYCQYTYDGPVQFRDGMIVSRSETINIRGVNRKVLTLESVEGKYVDNWIEGIGSIHNRYSGFGSWTHGSLTTMLDCYVDDICVYQDGDLDEYNELPSIEASSCKLTVRNSELSYDVKHSKGYVSIYGMDGICHGHKEGIGILVIPISDLKEGIYLIEANCSNCSIVREKIYVIHK